MAVKRLHHVRVDPITCDGRGVCAELFPERISLDDWGYPIIDGTPFGDRLLPHAKRAVEQCPLIALRLEAALAARAAPAAATR
jgi:ferredoxin